jgi:trk system potassium uptake protein TrkA
MSKKFAIIGLGHFGSYLAAELTKKGAEVLAIDSDIEKLEDIKDSVTYTIKMDSTEEKALKNHGLEEYDAVIVCIGDDFEASILTVTMLQQLGIKRIIVRATTSTHERILQHLDIEEIILPAQETADRLANSLMLEKVIDSFALTSEYTIVEAQSPEAFYGKSLQELDLRSKYEINVITIKKVEIKRRVLGFTKRQVEKIIGIPNPSTIIEPGDILVLFGKQKDIEKMLEGSS